MRCNQRDSAGEGGDGGEGGLRGKCTQAELLSRADGGKGYYNRQHGSVSFIDFDRDYSGSAALVKRLRLVKSVAPVPFWTGDDLAIAVVGIRAARLPTLLEMPAIAEFAKLGKGGLVMAGLAGGLASELHVGSVVVDGKNLPSSIARSGARIGLIHTSEHVVATVAEKARLLAETGCVAVDMETAIVRRFAGKRGLAFTSIRGISDTAREPLNPEFLKLLNEEGKPMIWQALTMIAKQPGRLRNSLRCGALVGGVGEYGGDGGGIGYVRLAGGLDKKASGGLTCAPGAEIFFRINYFAERF